MKKQLFSMILASGISLSHAGGVPTFDGVQVGIEMRNIAEQLIRNYTLWEQFEKQKEEYKNQWGETKAIFDQLQNLEFVETAYGYMPANWDEAVKVLQESNDNVPEEIKKSARAILTTLEGLDIQSEELKKVLTQKAEGLANEYELYLAQMHAAQERIRSADNFGNVIKNLETQKEREAASAQIGIENLKATSEVANILASKEAKEQSNKIIEEVKRQFYKADFDQFVNAGKKEEE